MNVVLVCVGDVNGVKAYAPLDRKDEEAIGNKDTIVCDMKSNKAARTEVQNRSIHLYFKMLCEALNDAGWDMIATMNKLSKKATIPWSEHGVKERLWRPTQLSTFGKDSTTKLDTNEVSTIYEALNNVTSSELGVSVAFPDRYSQMYEKLGDEIGR